MFMWRDVFQQSLLIHVVLSVLCLFEVLLLIKIELPTSPFLSLENE